MLLIRNKPLRLLFGMLETTSFLSLKLLFKKPSKLRLFPGRAFRTYMSLVGSGKWQCKSIWELFPEMKDTRITVEHLRSGSIETPIDVLTYHALITKALSPEFIFEIGTFRGRTALNFALNSPPGCKIYTLDLPPDDRERAIKEVSRDDALIIQESATGEDYRGKDVAHKIEQLFGNSRDFDFAPYFGKMDVVYVDGAHDYEAVKVDTQNALKMVKPGGVILWDDFAIYGEYNSVTRAIFDCLPRDQVVQIDSTGQAIYFNPIV